MLTQKLAEIDVVPEEIDAILVTHEHIDHIRGIEKFAEKHGTMILANSDTAKAICEMTSAPPRFTIFTTGETFTFRDLTVHPFSIQHDTLDPVAFTFHFDGMKLGVCADLGFATTLVAAHLKECDYLYLEANHEPSMVHACARPMRYKQRVLGRQGHLSNDDACKLLQEILHPNLKHIYLAHLSSECNNPELALKKAGAILEQHTATLSIAYQEKVSEPLKWNRQPVIGHP